MQRKQSGSDKTLPASNRHGFSLVEVLAALVITAMLMVALTPFVGQLFASWTRGSEAARLVELKTRGIGRLRDDLKHALVWTGFGETENLIAFRGNESSMSFPISNGIGAGRDGLEMLSVSVDTSVDGRALVRRRAAIVGSSYTAFRDPVVLFSGQFKFVFKYYSRDNQEMAVWTDAQEMPSRVELRISDRKGQIFSAPLEIPVFASLSAGCLVQRNLPGCPASASPEDEELMVALGLKEKTE